MFRDRASPLASARSPSIMASRATLLTIWGSDRRPNAPAPARHADFFVEHPAAAAAYEFGSVCPWLSALHQSRARRKPRASRNRSAAPGRWQCAAQSSRIPMIESSIASHSSITCATATANFRKDGSFRLLSERELSSSPESVISRTSPGAIVRPRATAWSKPPPALPNRPCANWPLRST